MITVQTLCIRLELYLRELDKVIRQWYGWLEVMGNSTATVPLEPNQSAPIESSALFQSVQDLVGQRDQLLTEARTVGARAMNLNALARSLPIWSDPQFRTAFEAARIRLTQLQRSHVATWVLLRESTEFCQDALMLIMSGKTRTDLTIDQNPPEPGGHLLDASL